MLYSAVPASIREVFRKSFGAQTITRSGRPGVDFLVQRLLVRSGDGACKALLDEPCPLEAKTARAHAQAYKQPLLLRAQRLPHPPLRLVPGGALRLRAQAADDSQSHGARVGRHPGLAAIRSAPALARAMTRATNSSGASSSTHRAFQHCADSWSVSILCRMGSAS